MDIITLIIGSLIGVGSFLMVAWPLLQKDPPYPYIELTKDMPKTESTRKDEEATDYSFTPYLPPRKHRIEERIPLAVDKVAEEGVAGASLLASIYREFEQIEILQKEKPEIYAVMMQTLTEGPGLFSLHKLLHLVEDPTAFHILMEKRVADPPSDLEQTVITRTQELARIRHESKKDIEDKIIDFLKSPGLSSENERTSEEPSIRIPSSSLESSKCDTEYPSREKASLDGFIPVLDSAPFYHGKPSDWWKAQATAALHPSLKPLHTNLEWRGIDRYAPDVTLDNLSRHFAHERMGDITIFELTDAIHQAANADVLAYKREYEEIVQMR